MIPVTKPFLPEIESYFSQIRRVFDNQWLTNRGELVLELESKLKKYLELKCDPIIMNNGTIPLQIAVKLLGINGEIITTPFSYVATLSSIIWEGCTPVFVDIDPVYLTINESKLEDAITEKTTCILATHVFGNPCNVIEIERIAKKYGLYVIYDAAHCFGVKYKGESIFNWGDFSTCSFHATKVFHTGEGGAAFIRNRELFNKAFQMHNFGHNGPNDFDVVGINGKMSELNAAMGLAILEDFDGVLKRRKEICSIYDSHLKFVNYNRLVIRDNTEWNYSYYPIVFENEEKLLEKIELLNSNRIFPRRYFYPSLNKLKFLKMTTSNLISESISTRILCLPVFHNLNKDDQFKIIKLLN
jgi:dTDP-4-amino-4,6-dideoxygalactose transaminase